MILLLKQRVKCANQEILFIIICDILHSFPQIQYIVFITELNQHRILDQRYLQKLKIRTLLMGLKDKSKNGIPLNVNVEFVRHLYVI